MKALTFNPGNDTFGVSEVALPGISANDVLIRVNACGINPVDAKIRYWKINAPDMNASWVPGLDVSGEIVSLGSAVTGWQVGDRVLCHGNMFRPHGGFAEFTVQDSRTLIPHPDLAADVAASTPCAGWTAWRALHDRLRVHEHTSALIAGGAGGVGGFAVQICRHFGLKTIIATCSTRNIGYVSSLGATHIIDYTREDVLERVMEITGQQGVEIGLDTIGAGNDILVANALQYEGQMVLINSLATPARYQDAFGRGLVFHQISLGSGHRNGQAAREDLVSAGKAFSALAEQGAIRPPALQQVSLDGVAGVLNEILDQKTVGKIVMTL